MDFVQDFKQYLFSGSITFDINSDLFILNHYIDFDESHITYCSYISFENNSLPICSVCSDEIYKPLKRKYNLTGTQTLDNIKKFFLDEIKFNFIVDVHDNEYL